MTANPNPDIETSEQLARLLVKSQFSKWGNLRVEQVKSSGTANAMFRLGADMVIRLPRTFSAVKAIEKEHAWLPRISNSLPLTVPALVAQGRAQPEYPWSWAIYEWIEGNDLWTAQLTDLNQAAIDVSDFILALRSLDTTGGPEPGEHNSFRGVPLRFLDRHVRGAIAELGSRVDRDWVSSEWERSLAASVSAFDVWLHGDLQPGNMLARDGRVSAVIDFGLLGVGDPAADLLPAWNLLDAGSRKIFRERLDVDDAMWIRGRGWALFQSLMALPYYWDSNKVMVEMAQRQLREMAQDA